MPNASAKVSSMAVSNARHPPLPDRSDSVTAKFEPLTVKLVIPASRRLVGVDGARVPLMGQVPYVDCWNWIKAAIWITWSAKSKGR